MQKELIDKFITLSTRQEFADLFGISDSQLRYFVYGKKIDKQYSTFYIKKRNGQQREINAPIKNLKILQRKILEFLTELYIPKKCVYGFVRLRGIKQNADNHVSKTTVINIDLKDFFSQIHYGRIYGALQSKPFCLHQDIAHIIAQIACFKGVLPQGAPTSPLLTNIICRSLDNQLVRLARENHCFYSRYADDLVFSSYKKKVPTQLLQNKHGEKCIGSDLRDVLANNGFEANERKICVYDKSTRQQVTGLTVNSKVNVSRDYLRSIRAIIHNCLKKGVFITAKTYVDRGFCKNNKIRSMIVDDERKEEIEKWFKTVLKGKLQFICNIRGVNDLLFLSLAEQLNYAFNEDIFNVEYLEKMRTQIESNVFLVKSADRQHQGTAFYLQGYGIITSYHLIKESISYEAILSKTDRENEKIASLLKGVNSVCEDKDIDFIVFSYNGFKGVSYPIGDSKLLAIKDYVTTIGYPNHFEGDSAHVQKCEITSTVKFHGGIMYTIKGVITHGYSGGIVLNERNEIVGLVKGGVEKAEEAESNDKQGFVPIHIILESIENQKQEKNAASG